MDGGDAGAGCAGGIVVMGECREGSCEAGGTETAMTGWEAGGGGWFEDAVLFFEYK